MAKYKVFDNIIAITNETPEEISGSTDFSKASIDRRIATGYRDAKIALTEPPKRAADIAKAITLRGSKQEKAEEHGQKLMEAPGGAELPPVPMYVVATNGLPGGSAAVFFARKGASCTMHWLPENLKVLLSLEFRQKNADVPVMQ